MFCDQCEQTANGFACVKSGVCGKDAEVAFAQDKLVYLLRRLAFLARQGAEKKLDVTSCDDFIANALFATLTNVNFDPLAIRALQMEAVGLCRELLAKTGDKPRPIEETPEAYLDGLTENEVGLKGLSGDEDVSSAMQILLYGLKGVCAYKVNAARLGQRDEGLSVFVRKALIAGSPWDEQTRDLGGWLELVLECGKANLRAMELLDLGNTGMFGDPHPSPCPTGRRKGKCILVSGHDYVDLAALLEQTTGTGINVYTHCEMLPAHGYPKLKAWPHLAGNFGGSWQNQRAELPDFPGPVLFTTNCIQNPGDYGDKVFTSGDAGWPGCRHCRNRDFSEIVRMAMEMPGFAEDEAGQEVLTGFGRKTLHDAIPAIAKAVGQGRVRRIFVVGGCDGARPTRQYYTDFVRKTPADTLVLTLACGKFRFYKENLGKLGDFPRLMDCGQCNDAYTAICAAQALAKANDCAISDLPISFVLSWYEQKAVSILLTLLYLGVKNIIIGPTLPAFISPAILKIISEKWGLRLMTTPDEDLKRILG